MASAAKYQFGGLFFSSKKSALAHFGRILRENPLGVDLPAYDLRCVLDLLRCHPYAAKKIGAGVASVRVNLEPRWNSRHFEIVRKDGSVTDFSYKKCLCVPTRRQLFHAACRHAVADQIIEYRNFIFDAVGENARCPILGTPLTPKTSHVDHIPPDTFENLVEAFIAHCNIDINTVQLAGFNDNEKRKSFVDDALTRRWQQFHKQRAKLRLVSPLANTSHIRRGVTSG